MRTAYRLLRLRQMDETLRRFRVVREVPRPPTGWLRAVREAVGMSSAQLARRLGVAQQTVSRFEKNERDETITLETLRKTAEVLGCDLVYALVPRESLERVVENQAIRVASERIRKVSHSMELEDQGVPASTQEDRLRELSAHLISSLPPSLWNT